MLSKMTRGNQITIPKAIVDRIGLRAGKDYLDIEYSKGVIHLKPVSIEDRIPDEVYEKFVSQSLSKEKGDVELDAKSAQNFLAVRAKKHK